MLGKLVFVDKLDLFEVSLRLKIVEYLKSVGIESNKRHGKI
jgi:hypothetical protein